MKRLYLIDLGALTRFGDKKIQQLTIRLHPSSYAHAMSNYYQPFSSSPPPPMDSPPKPPRRVSTIMSPASFQRAVGDDTRPQMMKRLTRVMNTRRLSSNQLDYDSDGTSNCHMDALLGKTGIIAKAISRDNAIVNQTFSFSATSLLSPEEENNEFYIPPPPLPKLVRLTLKKPVQIMTLDQRWLLQHAFAESTLLHYACAGDQYDVAKLLLEKGADWTLLNGSNKTAEMYTVDERIKELLNNAEDRYTPYVPYARQQQFPAPASPITASPPSILKRGNSSRRRQSIINDSSWADSNLRTTVHQSQMLNIRTTSTTNFGSPMVTSTPPTPSSSTTPQTSSPMSTTPKTTARRPTLAAKSRPEPEFYEEEPPRPIQNVVPTNYADISRSLARTTSAMGSMYSTAEVVTSMSQLELDADTVSVSSHNSHNSHNTATTAASNANRKRLSFRRGSRVIQALREKDTTAPPPPPPGPPAAAPPATAVVRAPPPPPPAPGPPPPPNTAEVKSPPVLRTRKSVRKLGDEESTVSGVETVLSARPLPPAPAPAPVPHPVVHRVPPPPPPSAASTIKMSIVEGSEEGSTASFRKSTKIKRGSVESADTKPAVRQPPPPPPSGNKAEAGTDADTITTATAASKDQRKSTRRTKEEQKALTPPPPPIRVMRRLSMNMSIGAVEAESYIEGADGQQILSTSLLGANSPDKVQSEKKIEAAKTASPEEKSIAPTPTISTPTPEPAPSTANPAVRSSHILRAFTAEMGAETYREAWEAKAEDPSPAASPYRVLQASMKSGADDGLIQANKLIARAAQMEKAEAREAKHSQAKAERLQFMLSKLTPLENIASGVLMKGRSVEELTRDSVLSESDHVDLEQTSGSLAARLFTATSVAQSKDDSPFSPGQSSPEKKHSSDLYIPGNKRSTTPAKEAFHSLKFRDMIWHRAAQHLNTAMSDKQRSHYDKARLDAYQHGVRLLKKEFSTMAYQEHWEAVDLVLEQRQQAAEKELKHNVRAFMLSNHDTPQHAPQDLSMVEQIGGRNSSFVPFSRISFAGLFNDEGEDSDE